MTVATLWPLIKSWMPAILLVLFGLMLLVYRLWRRRLLALYRSDKPLVRFENFECEKCGYPLKGLEIPRCPECGTLAGFSVPAEELGLTETELRRGFARQKRRRERRRAAPLDGGALDVGDEKDGAKETGT